MTITMPDERVRAAKEELGVPVIDSDAHMIECEPILCDYIESAGNKDMVDRYLREIAVENHFAGASSSALEAGIQGVAGRESREKRRFRAPWWGVPTSNTRDRLTVMALPLYHERLTELGIDFSVIYTTLGLFFSHSRDAELRVVLYRALNNYYYDMFQGLQDRMTPAAVIPMDNPTAAIEELDYAVRVKGFKAVLFDDFVVRGIREPGGATELGPVWYDLMALDSIYDYDPVWHKAVELGVSPTFHTSTQGIGLRASPTNYMFNHIGHFAAAHEALCKALIFGGVTSRFPTLKFGFLEGGTGWAVALLNDLIARFKKRGGGRVSTYDPRRLNVAELRSGLKEHGGEVCKRLGSRLDKYVEALAVDQEGPYAQDDFGQSGVTSTADLVDKFGNSFYFGCEADDRMTALAFEPRFLPMGRRVNALFSSDIGHWDVEDVSEVLLEVTEAVEKGYLGIDNARDLIFRIPLEFWAGANPDFFRGTSLDGHVTNVA